jgi:hypothetical protein
LIFGAKRVDKCFLALYDIGINLKTVFILAGLRKSFLSGLVYAEKELSHKAERIFDRVF